MDERKANVLAWLKEQRPAVRRIAAKATHMLASADRLREMFTADSERVERVMHVRRGAHWIAVDPAEIVREVEAHG